MVGSSSTSSSAPTSSLLLRYASLEDAAQDLDMVIQSTSQGEWSWETASEQERESWSRFVQDPSSATSDQISGLAGRVQVTRGVSLTFSLRSDAQGQDDGDGDDDGEGCKATVDVSAPSLSSQIAARIKTSLLDRSREWEDEGIESLLLFDLLTTAQTLAADLIIGPETEGARNESRKPSEPQSEEKQKGASVQLSRALFWSHHLKAPSKLKDFNHWCPELGIWGIVRVGYPGYLCFEGESSAVNEMVRRVKGLQWHAIQLRVEKTWTWTLDQDGKKQKGTLQRSPLELAKLSCALAKDHPDNVAGKQGEAKIRTGCQVIENLGELVTRLRSCGLDEDELEGALGIRMGRSGP